MPTRRRRARPLPWRSVDGSSRRGGGEPRGSCEWTLRPVRCESAWVGGTRTRRVSHQCGFVAARVRIQTRSVQQRAECATVLGLIPRARVLDRRNGPMGAELVSPPLPPEAELPMPLRGEHIARRALGYALDSTVTDDDAVRQLLELSARDVNALRSARARILRSAPLGAISTRAETMIESAVAMVVAGATS